MGLDISALPDNILRLMSPAQRRSLGQMTADEAQAKYLAGQEREFQNHVRAYLNCREIEFINPPMNRKSQIPPGWPDFTFCYRGRAVAIETKTIAGKLSPEQRSQHSKMERNGWIISVPRSIPEISELFAHIDSMCANIS